MAVTLIAYAKADIYAAKSAIEAVKARQGNEKAMKGIAAYHAQQAIEKIIKAEIYKANPKVNSKIMYTHKIYDLCRIAECNSIRVPRSIRENAYMYSDWEASGRYNLHFVVRIDSVEKAVRLAEDWILTLSN